MQGHMGIKMYHKETPLYSIIIITQMKELNDLKPQTTSFNDKSISLEYVIKKSYSLI